MGVVGLLPIYLAMEVPLPALLGNAWSGYRFRVTIVYTCVAVADTGGRTVESKIGGESVATSAIISEKDVTSRCRS